MMTRLFTQRVALCLGIGLAWFVVSGVPGGWPGHAAEAVGGPRPPGIVVAHSPAPTRQYLGSPSVVILPDGDLVVSHDFFGPGSTRNLVHVYGSKDRGLTWERRSEVRGAFWASLFVHRGALYLFGTSLQDGFVVIRRSNDGGRTWSEPKDSGTGLLLADAKYHCAPVPVVEHAGRLWRAFEDVMGPGGWGSSFRSFMLSAPVDADLLVATNWTASNRLGRDASWLDGKFGGWLEGNAVVTPDGGIANLLRADFREPREKAAVITVSADGRTAAFDPERGFVGFPGGCKKFTVRRDPRTGAYWGLANYIPPSQEGGNVERTRNTLALVHSPNLRDWEVRCVLLHHADRTNHGFQYPDWQFDGDDLVAAVRTAFDDEHGGAHGCHDANFITFHRWTGFRGLRPADGVLDPEAGRSAAIRGRAADSDLATFPNVLLIYADDLGYGDVGCYGAERVRTPQVDRLAREGLRFTDAHAAAATCTPSRYAMLTGEYAWRRKGTGVLPGDAALILEPGRTTLASMLLARGYATAVVGKWHLGLGPGPGKTDWNGEIRPGPLEVGFGYAFLMPATGDRVPCVYVENRRVVGLDPADPIRVSFAGPIGDEPTGKARPDLLTTVPSHGHDMTIVGGISRIGYMSGGKAARWKDADMADEFVRRSVAFLERHRREGGGRPFFLFHATHDIHVPRVPHARFAGGTPMGPRGDAIAQFDATVGELLGALDRLGYTTNTLVLLTSDNGPVVDDGYRDEAVAKLGEHRPAGPWRGGKYSAFEGGTRVPFLVRWPGHVKPGTTSDALIGQIDLAASLASLIGRELRAGEFPDSRRMLPTLIGWSRDSRPQLVEQAGALSLRDGSWKYIEPGRGARLSVPTNTETGQDPDGQLFDLAIDPGERTNRIRLDPEKAQAMRATLEAIRRAGGGQP